MTYKFKRGDRVRFISEDSSICPNRQYFRKFKDIEVVEVYGGSNLQLSLQDIPSRGEWLVMSSEVELDIKVKVYKEKGVEYI